MNINKQKRFVRPFFREIFEVFSSCSIVFPRCFEIFELPEVVWIHPDFWLIGINFILTKKQFVRRFVRDLLQVFLSFSIVFSRFFGVFELPEVIRIHSDPSGSDSERFEAIWSDSKKLKISEKISSKIFVFRHFWSVFEELQ